MVQWFGLGAITAEDSGSIPGRRTKIQQKKKKKSPQNKLFYVHPNPPPPLTISFHKEKKVICSTTEPEV